MPSNASAQVDQEVTKQLTAVVDGLTGVQDMLNQMIKQIANLPTLPDVQATQLEVIHHR